MFLKKWKLIRTIHEKLYHLGSEKCVSEILKHYWFPNMTAKVKSFIDNCLKCIMFTIPPHANNRTLHNIPKKPVPFDTLHMYM